MRLPEFLCGLLLCLLAPLQAATEPTPTPIPPDQVRVAPMKTSIYVGSVRLSTGVFKRQGSTFSTTYEAAVVPWFFWGETGTISITLNTADFDKLVNGQTAEFTGDALNQKNKPRKVTGRAQPADAVSGKIKVRVLADGVELIFNGTYRFGD